MDAYSNFLARKLTERIQEQQRSRLRVLIQGVAQDFPDYKFRAGYLQALTDVENWIGEINAEEDDQGRGPIARAS